MRLLFFAFVALLVTTVFAWTKEDHEIFDLVSAVEAAEGKGTTFYSWLGVSPSASTQQISKAYRKKSLQLHPDKNPGVPGIQERYARLGVITKILRESEGRERYDFFYKNGVPKWRGTGYYYSRFRPGLFTVLAFLTILSSGLHYLVQRLNYNRDVAIVDRTVTAARQAAWGASMQPLTSRRKVKVNLGGRPRTDDDGNMIGAKVIDMVVDPNGDVFIYDDGDLIPVDSSTATPPSVQRTWFIALVSGLFHTATGRKSAQSDDAAPSVADGPEQESDDVDSDVPGSGSVTPSYTDGEKPDSMLALKGGRLATSKAGGKRRKAVRKR